MREKKDRQDKQNHPPLRKHFAEILVANGAEEPYLIAFRYAADNVASQSLGSLIGFFEVEIHDHDAAYIVNFLASVAKKEYFANVRRGPVESFEAALHKVNVALSELVKHGNVSWLGHLNGGLAIVVGNAIHFSVTGDGALYLFRNQALRSISDGLALKEENPHPLKTFIEIASGHLVKDDRIFLFSPSVWTLFTPGDIEKSASRFSSLALEQFLRTAIVNELESGAVILVSCDEQELPLSEERKSPQTQSSATLSNVFAETAFREKAASPSIQQTPLLLPVEEREFIDEKTGHIYVHGDGVEKQERHPGRERLAILWQRLSLFEHQFSQKTERVRRRWKKELLTLGHFLRGRMASQFRSWIRKSRVLLRQGRHLTSKARVGLPSLLQKLRHSTSQSTPAQKKNKVNRKDFSPTEEKVPATESVTIVSQTSVTPEKPASRLGAWLTRKREFSIPQQEHQHINIPLQSPTRLISDSVTRFTVSLLRFLRNSLVYLFDTLRTIHSPLSVAWKDRSPLFRGIIFISTLIALIVFVRWIASSGLSDSVPPVSTPPSLPEIMTPPPFSMASEKGALELSPPEILLTLSEETLVATLTLKDIPYAITDKNIINLVTKERVAIPRLVTQATAMDDLNTIFLLAGDGSLLAYTPINKRFISNEIPLPDGVSIDAIGAYLTYLYVFDADTPRLYRFPRAEGGFGAPVSWFREDITLAPPITFAVGGIVALGNNDQVMSYEKGKVATKNFESPNQKSTLDTLAVIGEQNTVYALDRAHARILRWSEAGLLEQQYFSSELAQSVSFTLSPDEKVLFVGNKDVVLRFSLP